MLSESVCEMGVLMTFFEKIRSDFTCLKRKFNGQLLCYLDSAATSLKPKQVMAAMNDYYALYPGNVHRGLYPLSEEATEAYEDARTKIGFFVGMKKNPVVFTRNATESINLVAHSWGLENLKKGDTILLTGMEHHSNLVPWQIVASKTGAKLEFVELTGDGFLDHADFEKKIPKAKLFSFTHVSNVLGTVNPVWDLCKTAKQHGATVLVDASQSVPHMPVDFSQLGCDFLVFSGHKMLGPTGIGVLCAKTELLEKMPPFLSGGDMIKHVSPINSEWNDVPYKFEAGTPHIAGAIGLGAAVEYLKKLGMDKILRHEQALTEFALERLSSMKDVSVYGPKDTRKTSGVVSFNLKGVHAHDVSALLGEFGVCVRAGHHCAQPLVESLGVSATVRASVYLYNNSDEIERLAQGLEKVSGAFGNG